MTKPTIKEILGMIKWNISERRAEHLFISCKYGHSPVIRRHISLGGDDYKLFGYAVGRIVAYVVYERRKTMYAYAIQGQSAFDKWSNINARELPLSECITHINEMIADGFKGGMFGDAVARKKALMGKPLGTIRLWTKNATKYDYGKDKLSYDDSFEKLSDDASFKYWVYDFKGTIRIFKTEFPKTNKSIHKRQMTDIATAVERCEFPEFAKEIKKKVMANKEVCNKYYMVAEFNIPKDVKDKLKRMALLNMI